MQPKARAARRAAISYTLAVLLAPSIACASTPPAKEPRVVNITSDSAPGWVPTVEDETSATAAAKAYLAAEDAGDSAAAYAMMAEGDKALQSPAQFAEHIADFRSHAGAVLERRFIRLTWTKDPAHAPGPGVYLAIDLVSRFAMAQRSCGYLVLFRPPSGGDFKVAREETTILTDAEANKIESEQSSEALEAAWSKAAAACPNYPGTLSEAARPPQDKTDQPIPEDPHGDIGYPSVAAALSDLRTKKGVEISTQGGWTIVSDPSTQTIWSFAPEGHPAYPAVVKRQVVQKGGAVALDMKVLCQSTKTACDDLVRAFEQLNAQLSARLGSGQTSR